MRPPFGAQAPKDYSKWMWANEKWEWQTACVWTQKVGKPPKDFDDYHPTVLLALLLHPFPNEESDEGEEDETTIHGSGRFGPPSLVDQKVSYDKPHLTGDKMVDQWERDIAEGKMPDW